MEGLPDLGDAKSLYREATIIRYLGLGFRVLGLGFWVLGFGFTVLGNSDYLEPKIK